MWLFKTFFWQPRGIWILRVCRYYYINFCFASLHLDYRLFAVAENSCSTNYILLEEYFTSYMFWSNSCDSLHLWNLYQQVVTVFVFALPPWISTNLDVPITLTNRFDKINRRMQVATIYSDNSFANLYTCLRNRQE